MENIPNFGDLVESRPLDGDKLKIDGILDKPIIVTGFRIGKSKFNHKGTEYCTTLQFYFENDENQTKYIIFSGSSVIAEQVEEISAKLEESGKAKVFRAIVKKVGNYYSLT